MPIFDSSPTRFDPMGNDYAPIHVAYDENNHNITGVGTMVCI